MIEHIPTNFAQRTAFHWEQESSRPTRKESFGLEKHCTRYGGGKSNSKQESSSNTETTTTSNVEDNRQGVSEEGILAEEGSEVNVDRSVTNVVEDVSEEIAIAAIENSSGVAEIAVENSTQLAESAFDTSEALFNEATGVVTDVVESQQAVLTTSIRETQDSLRLAASQQGALAEKFLTEGKNLIQDQNRESGERLGNTAIIGAFALGLGFLALQFFKK